MDIVYFSNSSENTHRFIQKVGAVSHRLPLRAKEGTYIATKPYVLVTPTYGSGHEGGAVPQPVIRFLNQHENRTLIRGIVAAGNRNFGASYCKAGKIVSKKVNVPVLMEFELLGLPEDVQQMQEILTTLDKKEHDDSHRHLVGR